MWQKAPMQHIVNYMGVFLWEEGRIGSKETAESGLYAWCY
jgi:hypothetical protein